MWWRYIMANMVVRLKRVVVSVLLLTFGFFSSDFSPVALQAEGTGEFGSLNSLSSGKDFGVENVVGVYDVVNVGTKILLIDLDNSDSNIFNQILIYRNNIFTGQNDDRK